MQTEKNDLYTKSKYGATADTGHDFMTSLPFSSMNSWHSNKGFKKLGNKEANKGPDCTRYLKEQTNLAFRLWGTSSTKRTRLTYGKTLCQQPLSLGGRK